MDQLTDSLYRSFEEELNPDEKRKLEEGLAQSPELRQEKASIGNMRSLIAEGDFQFDEGFANRLMDRIEQTEQTFDIGFYQTFKRFALTGVAAIVLFLISIYFIDGSLTIDSIFGLSDYSTDNAELSFFNLSDFE